MLRRTGVALAAAMLLKGTMRSRTLATVGVTWLGLWLSMSKGLEAASWQCRRQPVEPCFTHHGRLSSQNGNALMIWLIGTRRIVALDNGVEELPPLISKYLEMTSLNHSYVYGDFDMCPLERDTPGHMRRVCVIGAQKLVVQDIQAVRAPFRLLSTWHPEPR